MCGISGLVNCGDRETLARMTHVQAHRGPDDSGLWEQQFPDGSYIGLGSRRLAILDLSAERPHADVQRRPHRLDHLQRRDLQLRRTSPRTRRQRAIASPPTPIPKLILHLYEKKAPDCVKRLNGMFAFAICDLRSGSADSVPGARSLRSEAFLLLSTMASVSPLPRKSRRCCKFRGSRRNSIRESLHQYLTFLWVPDPKTMFRGILKLPAGHYAILRNGELKHHAVLGSDVSRRRITLTRDRKRIWRTKFASASADRSKRRWSATFRLEHFSAPGSIPRASSP